LPQSLPLQSLWPLRLPVAVAAAVAVALPREVAVGVEVAAPRPPLRRSQLAASPAACLAPSLPTTWRA